MVSVIIPVLNEEKTIAQVVKFAKLNQYVSEVIVVDDKSTDNSVSEARNAGATVLISKQRGKGIDNCDFVKANFSRNAGRVTELVAKPLLTMLFPELAKFSQPLGGMMAGRKQYFNKVDFLPDYGVDVGLLIDMCRTGARMREVKIGYIQNKSKPWRSLVNMSKEVSGAILHKAFQYNIKPNQFPGSRELPDFEELSAQLPPVNKKNVKWL
jgi:glucosyl-3-phosphoglycerate synthase